MRAEIRELHNRLGATTIYVTHDQVEAITMSDKIVVLRNGKIEQIGAPLDAYDRPANAFVAGFIGSPAMNIFEAAIGENGAIRLGDGTALGQSGGRAAGGDVLCGIRPEHIALVEQGAPAVVRFVERQGAETLIAARIGPVDLTIVVDDRLWLAPDDRIFIAFDPSRLHFFDPRTKKRTSVE
jgi:multiple sugar transport system ATP-binding protein